MFSQSCPLLYKHKDALWISHKYILCNWHYEHSHRKYRMALKSSWSISIINNIIQKKWAVNFFISTDKTLFIKTNCTRYIMFPFNILYFDHNFHIIIIDRMWKNVPITLSKPSDLFIEIKVNKCLVFLLLQLASKKSITNW